MTDFTKTFRRTTYDTISPSAAANDQNGRTVLIVGGSEGVGLNIAQAFIEANAKEVIISSRSEAKLDSAVESLKKTRSHCKINALISDASDIPQIEALWQGLARGGTFVDVLVLSAAASDNINELDPIEVAKFFHANFIAKLHVLQKFQNQRDESGFRQKFLIDLSSAALQTYPHPRLALGYPSTKAGFSNYLCHLADIVPETEMRVVSLHPGVVYTPAVERATGGRGKDMPIWDDPSLSANMALWLSTAAAAFLHGRFVWANWDVDELMRRKEEIVGNHGFLKVGITGVSSFSMPKLMARCSERSE
ncbi:Putative short-chain dehydrogenase/reductase SDR, NAD(P)-binding domain superfamily [Septoria linicola]|uniref:Short-chain dehydrogenase/reductase SDR, NAD(P)-binding domain superfamily n=1 Tax=Septoria linicola TaxID=215465 RepID=A0A9Q9AR19_9PEZI|nr:Putative short-chain dehydrogenase/reductase SDR, NAD(P)-binding domain superfamily [Septoria linicola]